MMTAKVIDLDNCPAGAASTCVADMSFPHQVTNWLVLTMRLNSIAVN
jgi:hypothetical protein